MTLALAAGGVAAAAPGRANPPHVALVTESITGDCDPRDTTVTTTPEGLTATFTGLDTGSSTADTESYCHLTVRVQRPPGWTFTLSGARYTGQAAVGVGQRAYLDSTYHQLLAQPSPTPRRRAVFQQNDSGAWGLWQGLPAQESSCDGDTLLGFTAAMYVDRPQQGAASKLRLDRLQLRSRDFAWRRC
ncbi:hypothetical protein GCM10010123_38520 [Pilimelia anulata]|uniref:DUF4360 domain-containing protein n=2 Tax=Pilimelia anulata TaxID=53371 RepID=A0A8J3B991_9ACTN|nr:hypothetical protein GCM10010123_38520 [Pilimelia anulata]